MNRREDKIMAVNDPAQDRYNPPSVAHTDYEPVNFGDLEDNEFFWFKNENSEQNNAFRKINDNQGLNTKTRSVHNINYRTRVYQKL